jgi:hypothetical protein
MKYTYLFLFLILTLAGLKAQEDSTDVLELDKGSETQILIENLVEDADAQEFTFDTEFERLEIYRKNKIDINKATTEDLNAFGLLSALQVQALMNYRRRFGQIYSIYELQGVPAFDKSTIFNILPYVTLESTKEMQKFNWKNAFKYGRNQVFLRYQRVLEKTDGYIADDSLSSPEFQGNPDKVYMRYRMTYKDRMSFGLTLEKDQGEQYLTQFSQNNQIKLPDYYSAHFYLKDLNKNVKAVAIGDYQVFFGQGLTIWGGFGIRKGAATLNIKRLSNTIRPYTSVNEALFMRGAAATFGGSKWEASIFASHRFRDANVSIADTLADDVSFDVLQVSSLQLTGFHRTEAELADKNATQQVTTGANVQYRGDTWRVGANVVYNRLSDSLLRRTQLYQQYAFNGQSLLNASLDYALSYRNLQFFGETAVSDNGGLASLNGMLAALDPRVSVALLHRYYDEKYQTLTGNAFAEGTNPNNESGFYTGINAALGPGLTFSGYFDIFRFPWLRSNIDAPSRGYEYFMRLDYNPSYNWGLYVQYRLEEKQGNRSANETPIDYLIYKKRQNVRLHFRYRVNREFELRSRAEMSFYRDHENSKGFMMYQDFVWSPRNVPFKAQVRFAIFDTEDYDTRIYAYENDMLYVFSVPAYYGRGTRFYLNTSYKINRRVSLWFRYSQTYFADRDVISSGNNEIEGNTRSEIKAQIRVKF